MDLARILIVDDHPAWAKGLRALLIAEAPKDSQVIEIANDGLEAMIAAQALSPHLVLMDIQLPKRSGIDAAADIKAAMPETVIVMLTSSDEEEHLLAALKAGASGYLLKTLDLEEIAAGVQSVLNGNLVIPNHLAGAISQSLKTQDPTAPTALSDFEEIVLQFVGRGLGNDVIADELGVDTEEISRWIATIYEKLHISSRAEATVEAMRRGLTD